MKQRVYSAVLSAIVIAASGAAQADQAIDCAGSTGDETCDITINPEDGGAYRISADEFGIGIGDNVAPTSLPLVILAGAPAGALVVGADGTVNVGGSQTVGASLRVRRANGTAKILVHEANGTQAARSLFELRNNGPIGFNMVNTSGNSWRFASQTTGFRITLTSADGPHFEVLNNGDAELRGTLFENSDVNLKSGIKVLDGNVVLAKLDAMPVSEWSYKKDDPSVRHIGPMAQDFYAAFGLGTEETRISPRDMAGVNMAAIKALSAELKEKDAELAKQREQISALQDRLNELDQLKAQMTAIQSRLSQHVPQQVTWRN